MKKIIFVLLGAILVVGGLYAGLKDRGYNLNYKITVTIETPEGVKTGYAVREISASVPPISLPDVGNGAKVRGEAVVVDLGKRGVLFALISDESDEEFYNAFPTPGLGASTAAAIKYYNTKLKPGMKAEIRRGIPKMVIFTDMNDPKSVVLVHGQRFNTTTQKNDLIDNFEKYFGKDVVLGSYTLEITDGSVTWGTVDKWLPNNFNEVIVKNWRALAKKEKSRLYKIVTFKQGEQR